MERFNNHLNFKNMKIKYRLMSVMMLLIICFCIVVVICLQYVFKAYDEMLYSQSAGAINNSIGDIETELQSIEAFTLSISTDARIQQQLSKAKEITNEYDRAQILQDFKNKIFTSMLTDKYISSIRFVNESGYDMMVNQSAQVPDENKKNEAVVKAKEGKGANVWIEPDNMNAYLLSAREIRSIGVDMLAPLGTLIVQLNLDSLIQNHLSITKDKVTLAIWKGNQPIYTPDLKFQPSTAMLASKQGYLTEKIEGSSYFIAYTTSRVTGWTYYNLISYNNIFKKKNDLRFALLVVVLLSLLTVIAISYRVARGITKPIENLSMQMKQAEKGDFGEIVLEETDRSDEVGYLQRRFLIMIQRIEALIEENYTRQIMLKDTEFRALQAQINPHFLYNTLTSINWIARVGGQHKISTMVESLSRLLRNAMNNQVEVITLGEEIGLLQDYMNIQKVRYESELQFNLSVDERFYSYQIPKMLLQPIVENAIKHGLENMLESCTITVEAAETTEIIEVSVSDNGPGMEEEFLERLRAFEITSKGTGIGLKNINERLKLMYGEQAGLRFKSTVGLGTCVTVSIPKEGENHA
ncbi:cache domain-containing sensor histidine kinase [Paenibacillus whitsoniae]|uniref:histidine kinase n=1 Tax=Paenibacillus whitsoniae TaxID=2496558 RepID=A0A3S0ARJ2_9BACL|nr:sensor histidine kinase [Paenibacillus whitsoniae]RTE10888.1 sensor histidine kinase [Paenibacillus whitsoniae]